MAAFIRARELDPLSVGRCVNLARAYSLVREMGRSEELCKEAVQLEPNHPLAQLCLGTWNVLPATSRPSSISAASSNSSSRRDRYSSSFLVVWLTGALRGGHSLLETSTALTDSPWNDHRSWRF